MHSSVSKQMHGLGCPYIIYFGYSHFLMQALKIHKYADGMKSVWLQLKYSTHTGGRWIDAYEKCIPCWIGNLFFLTDIQQSVNWIIKEMLSEGYSAQIPIHKCALKEYRDRTF